MFLSFYQARNISIMEFLENNVNNIQGMFHHLAINSYLF